MARRRYRVSGKHKVFGIEPGETFTRDIPEVQEARLLASGAIERVGGRPAAPKRKAPPAPQGLEAMTTPAPQAATEASASKE